LSAVIEKFEAEHPTIEIHYAHGNPAQQLPVLIAGGIAPDLYLGNMANNHAWFAAPIFHDLTPFIQEDPEFSADDFIPAAINLLRFDGMQLGLPNDVTWMTHFFNVNDYAQA